MDMNLIKTDPTNMEIAEETSNDESEGDIKIEILHNELLPIDHQQIEIKDEFINATENLVSHEDTCFEYGTSFMHNNTLITEMQVHRDEIPYNCLENKFYSKKVAGFIDHECICESAKLYKAFDEKTYLEFTDEISNDESEVDIKIAIVHNELQLEANDSHQLEIKDKLKNESESLRDEKWSTYGTSIGPNKITSVAICTGRKLEKCLQCSSSSSHKCIYNNEIYKCVEENSSSQQKTHLTKDKLTHIREKLYKCLECDSTFGYKQSLKRHKLIHADSGKKPYKCLECNSRFSKKESLNKHKLIHTGEKPYKCLECDSSFGYKHNLNRHELIHVGKKPYKCLECDSRFSQKQSLNRHKLSHTGEKPYSYTGEKPYKCVECDSRFRDKAKLNRHKLIHAGKKPYKCSQCDSSFREKGTLNRHKRIHTDEKPYKCLQCDFSFRVKSNLNRHKLIHTAVKPYKCLQCDSSFRVKANLNRHKLIHTAKNATNV